MVKVISTTALGELWRVDLFVHDGVYRLDRYPVTVEHVPLPPADLSPEQREAVLGEFVLKAVSAHMRRGSLPPRGTRLDGREVWRGARGEVATQHVGD
jgi:hypothetical protein